MRPPLLSILIIALILLCQPALADAARHIPTFSECQKLANPKTNPNEKAQITLMFKTNGMYCSMSTAQFPARFIFGEGQTKTQLRIVMNKSGHYVIDGKSLMDALLPDRASIHPAQMIMLAGQIISILSDLLTLDPMAMHHASGRAGTLAAMVGVNARAATTQLNALQTQMRLSEEDVEPSFWLSKLALVPEPAPKEATPTGAHGPAWMQKLIGAGKHLLGTFQDGGGND